MTVRMSCLYVFDRWVKPVSRDFVDFVSKISYFPVVEWDYNYHNRMLAISIDNITNIKHDFRALSLPLLVMNV